jgi:ribosomal protein S16
MSLSIGVFNKPPNGPHYWNTFKEKVMKEVEFLTKKGHVKIDSKDPRWAFLKTNKRFDAEAIEALGAFKPNPKSKIFKFPLKGGGEVTLGGILKANVSVGSPRAPYNLGNVAEGILAFAIAARFLNKTKPIGEKEVLAVRAALAKNRRGTSSQIILKSPNAPHPKMKKKIDDDVKIVVNLAKANMDMLFTDDEANIDILKDELIPPCVAYANAREINTAALMMYRNGKKDYIDVIADGIGDETGTKVDVRLAINGEINVPIKGRTRGTNLSLTQISLKKDVNQFAQVGGWSMDKVDKLWGKVLDTTPSNNPQLQQIYQDSVETKGTTGAVASETMRNVYVWANAQIQTKLKNAKWLSHFVEVLDDFATYKEENVALVEITGDTFHRYDFKKLKVALVGRPDLDIPPNLVLSSSYTEGSSGLPTVRIIGTNTNDGKQYELVQFRFKLEKATSQSPVIRNYVEKRKGLEDYIG